jgi:vancomycin resistance protein YoaR
MWSPSVRFTTLSAVLGILLLAGAGGGAVQHWWPRTPVAQGVKIDDRRVPDGAPGVADWLEGRREAASGRTVHLRFERQLFTTTLGAAGVSLDVDATLDEARRVAHEGSAWRRLREAERARRGEIDVPPAWTVDAARARALLSTYAPELAVAPVDARIDLTQHTRAAEEPGRELDVEATISRLKAGTHDDDEVIDLVTRPVTAKVTLAQLTAVNIEKVVSAFETTFSLSGSGAGRAVNIKKAISHLDGTVLGPGQALSFNEAVGPRTRERGFALAPEIQGDEMQLGYGGGTCQASTTLYAAALFGALDILERQAHSRPSHYAQMGLDATVSYPLADLKIRNSMRFPVLIHAFLPNPTTVRVEILGGDPVARVEYVYGVSSTEDFFRRIQVKDTLPPGQRELHQKGIPGFDVTSVVKLHYYDGREDERHYYSGYRPAPEIYWVAPGYDLATLPPLPEHAKGIEPAGEAARGS